LSLFICSKFCSQLLQLLIFENLIIKTLSCIGVIGGSDLESSHCLGVCGSEETASFLKRVGGPSIFCS